MRDTSEGADRGRALGGAALSLAAAATFGVFAPAAKASLDRLPPLRAAGLVYAAAGLAALGAIAARRLMRSPSAGRSPQGRDALRLIGMVLLGGAAGPALFFAGLDRVAAHHAAVVQHLEFALTVVAAVTVLGERPGRRGWAGLALIAAGLLLFTSIEVGGSGSAARPSPAGLALLAGACVAWAADNTLARGASDLDPMLVVAVKGLCAGALLLLATARTPWTFPPGAWGLVALAGGAGVGLSLVLELLALRRIGAALNAGLFATGPAFGFAWSLVFLGERASARGWAALGLCALGAVALSIDRHAHRHVHPAQRHTHRHDHRDRHHEHAHEPGIDPAASHVHEHDHDRVDHSHPHAHDEEHRHRH